MQVRALKTRITLAEPDRFLSYCKKNIAESFLDSTEFSSEQKFLEKLIVLSRYTEKKSSFSRNSENRTIIRERNTTKNSV